MKKVVLLFFLAVMFLSIFIFRVEMRKNFSLALQANNTNAIKLFAPNVVNTDADEYGPTFTPDGETVYFAKRINRKGSEAIYFSTKQKGNWSSPQVASFSGQYYDKEPYISPDGKKLFFASTRPNNAEAKTTDFNLWFVERKGNGWSEPQNLGAAVNSSTYDNYPAVAANGNLYFGSTREGGRGEGDLYVSHFINGKYESAVNLGVAVNSAGNEADPYIAPDESYIIFSGERKGGYGEGDLYITYQRKGIWTAPKNLGTVINTTDYEYTPLVSADGKYLFFSRGWGEIYFIETSVLNLFPKISAKELTAFEGTYEITQGVTVTFKIKGENLFSEARGRSDELVFVGDNEFALLGANILVKFIRNADDKITEISINDNGQTGIAKKVK